MLRSRAQRRRISLAVCPLMIAGAAAVATVPTADAATTGVNQTYVVVYSSGASTAGADATVASAGGTLVANYRQIGVVIVNSASSTFATRMSKAQNVTGISATGSFGVHVEGSLDDSTAADPTPAPNSGGEPLAGLQWDMA